MPKPQPVNRSKGVSLLVYGVPGSGKTRLAGSAANSLILRPPTDHTDSIDADSDVQEIILPDWSSVRETFQWGQQGGFDDFDWVWLDSISLFQDHGLDDVFADAVARKPDRAQFGPDKGEYGINMNRLSTFVRDMVGLASEGRMNFGITAHPFEWYDPIAQDSVWAPWVQGNNMSPKVCGYMNIVAYLQEVRRDGKPTQRVLLTDAPGFVGKDQFNCVPELKSGKRGIVDPTMPKLIQAIKKARSGRSGSTTKRRPRRRRSS